MKSWLLLGLCVGLGACGSPEESGGDIISSEAALAPDAPLEIAITQFPGGYQARWAVNAANCVEENSEQIISLQGKLVKFHESIGTMTAGKRETSREMEADFEFVGEGEKWNKSIGFKLSEDGTRLTRTDKNDGASYQYVQCPKLMAG